MSRSSCIQRAKSLSLIFLGITSQAALAQAIPTTLRLNSVSELPITGLENPNAKLNLISIVGGKGIQNYQGESKNFLARTINVFASREINVYLFPNASNTTKATYPNRTSNARLKRLKALVSALKDRNNLPVFLAGFSRGSVDSVSYLTKHPNTAEGVAIISGIYSNDSNRANEFSLELLTQDAIEAKALIVHHLKDSCLVSDPKYAKIFYANLRSPSKSSLFYEDGIGEGKDCGPYNYHGYFGIEGQVANEISSWLVEQVLHQTKQ